MGHHVLWGGTVLTKLTKGLKMAIQNDDRPSYCKRFPTVGLLRAALARLSFERHFRRRCPSASGAAWVALQAACAPNGSAELIDPDYADAVLDEAAESILRVSCDVDSMAGSGSIGIERIAGKYFHTRDDFGEIRGPFDTVKDAIDALDFGGGIENPNVEGADELAQDELEAFALGIMDLENCRHCAINGRRYTAIERHEAWELVASDAEERNA